MLNASFCIYTLLLFAKYKDLVSKQGLIFLPCFYRLYGTFCKGDEHTVEHHHALHPNPCPQVTNITFTSPPSS